jgi:hypothetical protein
MEENKGYSPFPPIDVYQIDGELHIADGHHRWKAAQAAGLKTVQCVINDGTESDMMKTAFHRNIRNALQMTDADIKHGREIVIRKFPNKSDRELAEICGCSAMTICRAKKELEEKGLFARPETVIGKDGKERKSTVTLLQLTEPPSPIPSYCSNGCGTPIWPENKGNPDSTYCEMGGHWFCSPECMDEWESKQNYATDMTSDHDPEETDPFTEVDVSTLPEYEPKEQENNSCFLECAFTVQVFGTTDPEESVDALKAFFPHRFCKNDRDFLLKFLGLCINNINKNNNNINVNQEIFPETTSDPDSEKFTRWQIKARGKKSLTTVAISKKKYEEWNKKFGRTIDIDATLDECCSYYNDLQGDDILSAGIVYSKVFSWLNTNAKRAEKEKDRPKKSSGYEYPAAGVHFDPSMYE